MSVGKFESTARFLQRHSQASLVFVVAILLSFVSVEANAVEVGQLDDFEDGTEQNWIWGRTGFGGPVAVGGGPTGTYLETESFGGDDVPGSRMAIINREQWTGDYLAAGVRSIQLDAYNDGPNFAFEDMTIRIGFSSELASTGSGRVITSDAFPIARGDGWQQFEFDLTNLTPIAGSNVTEVMSSVSEVRIISAATPSFIGEQVIARLGIDNITAVTVPEPTAGFSTGLSWLACVALVFRARRSSK